jgi:Uncharacterised nucleotidyltransferase
MSPEDELCLLLSRGQLSRSVRREASELLATPLQWDRLLRRASAHQILPLVYQNLRALDFFGVPRDARTHLTLTFRRNALRNEFLARELSRVLWILSDARVPVIPLKGVALAERLYGDPARRVCSDLDILVPPDTVPRARRRLLDLGYTSPFSEDFFLKHQFLTSADCSLLNEESTLPYLLEVHWTLLQHSSKDQQVMQDLWSQARPQECSGSTIYKMTPEWELLYLAAHAAYHKWHTLKWLADIHDLCLSTRIDWEQVKQKAERFELTSIVRYTLTACSSLFGMPMPPYISALALPAGVRLFPESLVQSEIWKAPLFYPRLLRRPSEKLRWLAEMLFIARLADRTFFHLPTALNFLYYVLRPLRLAFKWSRLFGRAAFESARRHFLASAPPGTRES